MQKAALYASSWILAVCLTTAARSNEIAVADTQTITVEQASRMLNYSGGNDRMRLELAPNYSEELGFSMRGAAGGYLTDQIALGLIVEYGENKQEYLGNAGIQFNDALRLVGTVGMLEESYEYVEGEGRKEVRQMEYGASLKADYEASILTGFELNGYLTNAETNGNSVETGALYGMQVLADIDLTTETHFKLGGGYEWLAWDDGGSDDSFAFTAVGEQQLGSMLSITANASLGASQNIYGGGFALDLNDGGGNANLIQLDYSYIDGRNGVEDDQRIELSWTYGFGSGPARMVSGSTGSSTTVRPTADALQVTQANDLLGDVMKRPRYLPESVVARSVPQSSKKCTVGNYLLFVANPATAPASFTLQEVGAYASAGDDDIEVRNEMGVGTFDIYKQISPNDFEIAFTSVALVLGHNNVPGAYNALKANSAFAFTEVAGSCYALTWYNNW